MSSSTTSPLIASPGAVDHSSASAAAVAAARAESAAHSGDFGPKLQAMRATFRQGCSKPLDFRLQQLRQLEKMVRENEASLCAAMAKDLGRCDFEAIVLDMEPLYAEIRHALSNLKSWLQPVQTSVPLALAPAVSEFIYEPHGVVFIMGAFNYPVSLVLIPLVGAICGGNCAVIKPSDISVSVEGELLRLIPQYLDRECFAVVHGDVPVTTRLLELRWDKIFFTGSPRVARIVMAAAAKHLTPVSLELGGKSPVYIDSSCTDMDLCANRVMWGKYMNCGQTCVAPDYVLCHKKHYDAFISACGKAIDSFYGSSPLTCSSFGRMVTAQHASRIQAMITEASALPGVQVVRGATAKDTAVSDPKDSSGGRFVPPTLLTGAALLKSRLMAEEVFGPVLSVIPVDDMDQALSIMAGFDSPLAMYVFAKNRATIDKIQSSQPSGALVVNDVVLHVSSVHLPFGGVGCSGIGTYHGEHSIQAFCYKRAVLRRDDHALLDLPIRYPPYKDSTITIFRYVFGAPALPSWARIKTSVVGTVALAAAAVAVVFSVPDIRQRVIG